MKILKYGTVMLCIFALWGCSKGNPDAPVTIDPVTGKHPAGWAANGAGGTHTGAYFAAPGSCIQCHGQPSDPAGGVSKVSCSNPGRSGVACHANFPHVANFAAFNVHGGVAKDVASGITGMAHCQKCHGTSYTGADSAPSCIGCHKLTTPSTNAPHAANWISGNANGLKHSTTAESNAPACAQCHLGGRFSHAAPNPAPAGTAPGCFNGTLCHNNAVHPLPFVAGHQADAKANLASCQLCHATPSSGSNPRYNLLKGTGVLNPNGCEDCHNKPGIAHPFMWLPGRGATNGVTNATTHATAGTVNISCGLCHGGTALTGGSVAYPGGIAPPSCFSSSASSINGTSCHITKPVDSQGADIGCISCHGIPPATGKHGSHFASIPNVNCAACHNNLGPGNLTHADGTVNLALLSTYQAKTVVGTFAFDPGASKSCANVSCHGGQTTPSWTTGSINVNTDCTRCHNLGTAQYNSYNSGIFGAVNLHDFHLNSVGLFCTDCHNTTNLAINHFTHLETQIMEGPASATIGGGTTGIVSYVPGNVPGSGSCSPTQNNPNFFCHVNTILGNTRAW